MPKYYRKSSFKGVRHPRRLIKDIALGLLFCKSIGQSDNCVNKFNRAVIEYFSHILSCFFMY